MTKGQMVEIIDVIGLKKLSLHSLRLGNLRKLVARAVRSPGFSDKKRWEARDLEVINTYNTSPQPNSLPSQ